MATKEYTYRGKTMKELEKIDIKEFANMVPARQRRSLLRGFTPEQKKLLEKVKKAKQGIWKKPIKTHCSDIVITPELVGIMIHVHKGREYIPVAITQEMLGHYIGEMLLTRQRVTHSAPGIGATKSSGAISVK